MTDPAIRRAAALTLAVEFAVGVKENNVHTTILVAKVFEEYLAGDKEKA